MPLTEASVDELIEGLGGFVVSHGAGVHPAWYGGDRAHPKVERIDVVRNGF